MTLRTLVDLLTQLGACRDATILYGAVQAVRTGAPPFGSDEAMLRESGTDLRAQLGQHAFRQLVDYGATLTEEQVVTVALDVVGRAALRFHPTEPKPAVARRLAAP